MISRNNRDVYAELAEINPDALTADGLEDAYVGYRVGIGETVAVYDYQKCVEIICRDHGSSIEDAEEYLQHNTIFAYFGPHSPVYVRLTTVRM